MLTMRKRVRRQAEGSGGYVTPYRHYSLGVKGMPIRGKQQKDLHIWNK